MKVLEQRLSRKIEESVAPKVIEEIERTNNAKETEEKVRAIRLKLSEVYAMSKKNSMVSECGKKLTEEGTETYRLLSDAVLELSKLKGSKTLNRIANRTNYNNFSKRYGVETVEKLMFLNNKGKMIQSVFADIIVKGLTDKYLEYLENTFLPK